ncbi:9897_t:CDS:1 [Ambispora leptoticha]|uniref:9897_t:CDS:1 n=1 Tax=Ambispora leptoticha TaxID=144679 RepID=A0A9N8V8M4_9GLOM|nr:9897_t:CDS:1 [Ambispora leptoticha]
MQAMQANTNKKSITKLTEPVIPRFPPEVTALNLLEKAISKLETTQQSSRIPNAFIAYRMAVCKELRLNNHPVITQPQLSSMAKQSWSKEPEHVRKAYQRIAAEARDIYKRLCYIHLPPQARHESQFIEETSEKDHTVEESAQDLPSQEVNSVPIPSQEVNIVPVNNVPEFPTVPSPTWSNSTVGEVQSSPIADFSIINESEYMTHDTQYTDLPYPVQVSDENLCHPFNFHHHLSHDYNLNQFSDESFASQFVPTGYEFLDSQFYSKDTTIAANYQNAYSQPESKCEKCRSTIVQLENKVEELERKLSNLTSLITTKLAKKV